VLSSDFKASLEEIEKLTKKEIEEIAKKAADRLKDLVSTNYKKFTRKVIEDLQYAYKAYHRRLLVIAGLNHLLQAAYAAYTLTKYEKLVKSKDGARELKVLYVFHDEFNDAKLRKEVVKRVIKSKTNLFSLTIARYEESDRYLGTTFKVLVLDLVNDLKPNDVGRLVDVVEGGGLVIFFVPPWSKWDKWMTLFKQNLLIFGYNEPRHIFISWFKRKLMEHKGIHIYDVDEDEPIKSEILEEKGYTRSKPEPPRETRFPRKLYELAVTQDQVKVVKAMEELVEKPKKGHKKVIIVTADRGRGKSCAVGIGCIGLIHSLLEKGRRKVRILVTAPNLTSVQSFFELALKAAEELDLEPEVVKRGGNILELYGDNFSIEYWEPIDIPKKSADIVVVDEAAGIHVPLLHKIWRAHRRLVFATTIHGYEGAGRGFSVRFLSALRKDPRTELIEVELHEPIRYAPNDPIEKWLFDTLLLDAEPAELDEEDIKAIEEKRLEYLKLDPYWLFSPEGEKTLRQLFGIYVMAHYRNEPDDLGILADAPHHIIRALRVPSGKIVCAVQIAQEGGLDDDVIDALLRGEKTPGNIIPDRLLKHLRIKEFGSMKGWRIVRIATHPKVQGKGIGSKMLEEIYKEAKEAGLDWIGSGFGVNEQLLNFWLKNGFKPVHMSPDRNPVSGEYTILVIKPINEKMKKLVELANAEFRRKLIDSLHDTYHDLETEVALMILRSDKPIFEDYRPALTPIQVDRLWIYAYGPMTYEAMCDVMHEFAKAYWYTYPKTGGLHLSKKEEYLITAKVLQAKPWATVADEMRMHTHTLMVMMKEIARKILKHYYKIDEHSIVGLDGEKLDNRLNFRELLNQPLAGLKARLESRKEVNSADKSN